MALRDPERYLDRRTFRRHLKRGNVTEADYQKHLAELPDLTENIMPKEEGGDDDGYEQRVVQKAQEGAEAPAAEGGGDQAAAPEGADGPTAG